MARTAALVLALVAVSVVPAAAQVTGRVEGRVVDALTGAALVGGLVMVEGTNRGNITRDDGSFFINEVPVGRHKIVAEYLGYTTVAETRRVLAGETIAVDFRMPSDMIAASAIVAVVEHEPWTPPPLERVVTKVPPPGGGIPVSPGFRCSARGVIHGAFIARGRWELMTSIQDVQCRDLAPPREVPPCEQAPLTGIVRVTSGPGDPQDAPQR